MAISEKMKRIERFIAKGMKKAQDQGYKITRGTWGIETGVYNKKGAYERKLEPSKTKAACALGALILSTKGALQYNPVQGRAPLPEDAAAALLGVDADWVSEFVCGFDDGWERGYRPTTEVGRMGRRLARKFTKDPDSD